MQGLQRELSRCKHFTSDFQYFRKIALQNKLQFLWIHYCPNTNVDLEKVLMHNIARNIVKKWKNVVDKKKVFGTVLTDYSKAFDGLSNDLIIAKLNV